MKNTKRQLARIEIEYQKYEPTMAALSQQIDEERMAKRLKIRPPVKPIIEYVSLLNLCYHHAFKSAA